MKDKYLLPFLLFMDINDEENKNKVRSGNGCGGCWTIIFVVAALLLAVSICSQIVH